MSLSLQALSDVEGTGLVQGAPIVEQPVLGSLPLLSRKMPISSLS